MLQRSGCYWRLRAIVIMLDAVPSDPHGIPHMQTLLGIRLPRFARYGWIFQPQRGRGLAEWYDAPTRAHYLAALLGLARKWG